MRVSSHPAPRESKDSSLLKIYSGFFFEISSNLLEISISCLDIHLKMYSISRFFFYFYKIIDIYLFGEYIDKLENLFSNVVFYNDNESLFCFALSHIIILDRTRLSNLIKPFAGEY